MSKHTPGPWIYDIHEHSFYIFDKDGEMVADGDPDDIGIARMRGVGRGADAPEQEANANLIAAAPELLEACILIDEFAWTAVASDCEEARVELNRRVSAVRAAIAKAEGRDDSK